MANGYIKEAYDFYRNLFPLNLIEMAASEGINLKVIIMCSCYALVPDCLIAHSSCDSSLMTGVLNSKSTAHFGYK